MESKRELALAWEAKWARPAALGALAGVGLVIVAVVVATQAVGGSGGDAELLRQADRHGTAQMISSVLQAIGVGLLALPLYYLFRAARVRSEAMRGQLVGLVIAAPLFLAGLAIVSGITTLHAASDFVASGVQGTGDHADKLASDAISEAPLRPLAVGLGIAGQIGFLIAMFYTSLQAMRTGLLTRFWGSLGMALGAVSFLFFQFALIWFVYLGFLYLGRIPGGRPPAWPEGKAIPWPTPGEKAAAELRPEADEAEADAPQPPRKRKQRALAPEGEEEPEQE